MTDNKQNDEGRSDKEEIEHLRGLLETANEDIKGLQESRERLIGMLGKANCDAMDKDRTIKRLQSQASTDPTLPSRLQEAESLLKELLAELKTTDASRHQLLELTLDLVKDKLDREDITKATESAEKKDVLNVGIKRTLEEMTIEDRVVCCLNCYKFRLECDKGNTCKNCARGEIECKRAKCEHWEEGTCLRQICHRWHEGDGEGYNVVDNVGRVSRIEQGSRKHKVLKRS